MSVEKSKHSIADLVFSLFCYFTALVIGGIGYLFYFLFGGFLIRISQACGHGEFRKLVSLKYWMGKEEPFKF